MKKSLKTKAKRIILGGLLLFFCLSLFSFFISPCFAMAGRLPAKFGIRKTYENITVQGKVTVREATTLKPIPNAIIELHKFSGEKLASVKTDASGNYKIVNTLSSNFYLIRCKFQNQAQQRLRTLTRGKTYTIDFQLKPIKVTIFPTDPVAPVYVSPQLPGERPPSQTLQPPKIDSVIPVDHSTFLVGARMDLQINATDPDNDSLEYQFSIGGALKRGWSSLNLYTWQTSTSDTGYVSVTCEARTKKGATVSKTITYCIINPTIQEILQKVTDNYALVNDKKMDVTMTSKFNNETFGETIYTRHYFKTPDKQRTDTFSSQDRAESSMTEIQITKGPDTYLIDPISQTQSQKNLLTELNLTQEQLYQMDEIYHLQDFLDAHTIVRKDNPLDLAKGLVMIEAVSKNSNNLYSKLDVQFDYFKGLKTKSLTYLKEDNQDKLKQAIEITESQKMLNGAWVPRAQVKILYLTEGNLIMTYNFENVQINTGLPDYLFDPTEQ